MKNKVILSIFMVSFFTLSSNSYGAKEPFCMYECYDEYRQCQFERTYPNCDGRYSGCKYNCPDVQEEPKERDILKSKKGNITAIGTNLYIKLNSNGKKINIYNGTQSVVAIKECRGGVFTAFSGKGIYFSPNYRNLGGGGNTRRVYSGIQGTVSIKCESGTGSVITKFDQGGVYKSPDGNNLGGGGNTKRIK